MPLGSSAEVGRRICLREAPRRSGGGFASERLRGGRESIKIRPWRPSIHHSGRRSGKSKPQARIFPTSAHSQRSVITEGVVVKFTVFSVIPRPRWGHTHHRLHHILCPALSFGDRRQEICCSHKQDICSACLHDVCCARLPPKMQVPPILLPTLPQGKGCRFTWYLCFPWGGVGGFDATGVRT